MDVYGIAIEDPVASVEDLSVDLATLPIVKDLVLLGGGHSHVRVLKDFGLQPMGGLRITLVSDHDATPYSGMLPGVIAGHYKFDEAHIDLRQLCQFARAQFFETSAIGIDLNHQQVHCAGRPPISFDVVSVNVGSTPNWHNVPGASEFALPVKPVAEFLCRWKQIIERVRNCHGRTYRIAVVGGGAGGVELTLAALHRLEELAARAGQECPALEFHLVSSSETILPTHNRSVQRRFSRILRERGVLVHLGRTVTEVHARELECNRTDRLIFDTLLWATDATPAHWIRQSGLQTDERGFLAVNDCLQSVSHPFVFSAGDAAAVLRHRRPKSGVFAVRQGKPLAHNLRSSLLGRPLRPFVPQRAFLSLISTGNKYAVASRGCFALEGQWVWRWKDWIDRRWMRQYQHLPKRDPAIFSRPEEDSRRTGRD